MGTDTRITVDEYATTLIRLKARRLIGRYGFTKSDREDIQQELTLDVLLRLDRFDPTKGRPATFVRMIVDRRVASLIRERKSLSRGYRRTTHSLDEFTDQDDRDGKLVEPAIDDRCQRDLEIDMTETLNALSNDLRSIADDLCDKPLAAIAREHRCNRAAMRRNAGHIREHLARCGMDEYTSANQNGDAPRK